MAISSTRELADAHAKARRSDPIPAPGVIIARAMVAILDHQRHFAPAACVDRAPGSSRYGGKTRDDSWFMDWTRVRRADRRGAGERPLSYKIRR